MVSLAQQVQARNIHTGKLLIAADIYDSGHHLLVDQNVVLEGTLLDRMLARVAFTTIPRAGNGPDKFDIIIGRDVYYALTVMDEYREHLNSYPELYVGHGTRLFYKGFPVTTDAMFRPGQWMLQPSSIVVMATRTNGSTILRRPFLAEPEIPTLDEADILPEPPLVW